MAHLRHGISTGANPTLDINVIIEIPGRSKCKYELYKIAGIINKSLEDYKEKYRT